MGAGRTYQLNINSIHAYNGVKNNNSDRLEKGKKSVRHPLMMENSIAFKDKTNPSTFERLIRSIRNFDYMEALGKAKQGIEITGFWLLFIIQDVIGMTAPRTWTGFNRDREVTGKYHIQEGFEVLGREGLTGPAMMAIPAAAFAVTAATMGKSTFTNSRLIRSLGKSLTNTAKDAGNVTKNDLRFKYYEDALSKLIKDTLQIDADKATISKTAFNLDIFASLDLAEQAVLKTKSFQAKSLEKWGYGSEKLQKILKDPTISEDTVLSAEQIKKVFKFFKKDMPKEIGNDIQGYINNHLLETPGADLSKLDKVKLDDNYYSIKDFVEALIKYGDDAITNNKKFDGFDEKKAEEFMNSMLGKRCVANIGTMGAVLGIMNYLPKLYAYGDTAPGEVTKKCVNNKQNITNENNVKGNVAFTGLMSSLGKQTGKLSNGVLAEGEFRGINFSNTIMSAISIIGLTYPRAARAYARAPEKTPEQRQNEGWFSRMFKKDASEIKEIAIRDPISALSVVFAVPLLTRGMIKSYEGTSGFVLINHQENEGTGFKKFLKYLNPYNSITPLENAELEALYGKVDSHNKLVNVCEFLTKKGGDLEKIFAKAIEKEAVFNDSTFTLKSIQNEAREVKNAKILEFIKSADAAMQAKMVDSLLPTLKKNKALGIAKTLNAIPFFLNLLVISPFILGSVIPKYTYKLTRNANAQKTEATPQPALNIVEQEKAQLEGLKKTV